MASPSCYQPSWKHLYISGTLDSAGSPSITGTHPFTLHVISETHFHGGNPASRLCWWTWFLILAVPVEMPKVSLTSEGISQLVYSFPYAGSFSSKPWLSSGHPPSQKSSKVPHGYRIKSEILQRHSWSSPNLSCLSSLWEPSSQLLKICYFIIFISVHIIFSLWDPHLLSFVIKTFVSNKAFVSFKTHLFLDIPLGWYSDGHLASSGLG